MKTILLSLSLFLIAPAFAEDDISKAPAAPAVAPAATPGPAQIKKVCKTVKNKEGKEVQQCKNIKVHKKVEGTVVPEKKK